MVLDKHKHDFDNCPECKGMCLVLIGGMPPRRARAFQIIAAAEWIINNPAPGIKLSRKDRRGIKAAQKEIA